MSFPEIPLHTLKKQHEASDPAASVWVAANAGSGKTHVLAQRVIRLLLRGVAPAKILCLTFTKAAAANMAGRVFDALAAWTRLSDEELCKAILATGAPAPGAADLKAARRLFARAVETPGGLKIQTIHAFCERLLHLFPFEANAPSRFEVADEARQAELLLRAQHEVFAAAATDERLGEQVQRVAEECGASDFPDLIKEAMAHRARFRERGRDDDPGSALRRALGLAPGQDLAAIEREMAEDGVAPARWREIAAFLDGGGKTDQKRASLLRDAASAYELGRRDGDLETCLASYLAIFFIDNGRGNKAASILTKGLAGERPDIADELYAEQERLDGLRPLRKAASTFDRTMALEAIVVAIVARYEAMKAARGVLDFEDLVDRASALLERSDARWVLYKLDAGIDHILVDEAQDTSAEQWRILEELTTDFAAGETRSPARRTFFAVGDEKQSIFSFQGAAPHMFGEMRRKFETRFAAGSEGFAYVRLSQSFRSAPGVLAAVDKVFEHGEHKSGLVAANDVWMPHESLKRQLPDLVEIWPPVGARSSEDPSDWRLPLDLLDAQDPASLVAERVACKIAALVAKGSGEYVHDGQTRRLRPVGAGDVMILVRRRDAFFEAVIRALKRARVPVAGVDRLELAEHIAVADLIAAGRAALLPEDDLNLACVLKSPLIGLDDDDLLAIAPKRETSLFAALGASSDPRCAAAFEQIGRWRERAALSPFAFYSRLLCAEGGRRAMEARLGPEARDAIDEFLRLALAHDGEPAPSLVAFLNDVESMECSIRRDMEAGLDAVRVMTVHAAKGLEAKIVFLPDTCSAPSANHAPKIFELGGGSGDDSIIAWSPRRDADCAATATARERALRLAEEEYRRLLYVALTRAEERLYIAGFHGEREPSQISWAAMIDAALCGDRDFERAAAFWDSSEQILRRATPGAAQLSDGSGRAVEIEAASDNPAWLWRAAPPEPNAPPPLRPSNALAAADRRGEARLSPAKREALRRGSLTHALLQYLPGLAPLNRRAAGLAFLSARADDLDMREKERLIDDALRVIEAPALSELFGPGSKAEVSVAGKAALASGRVMEVVGQVDRICETRNEVLIADFKTGAPCSAEETPAPYLLQMALYRAVLAPLWPEKNLRLMLIWTVGPHVADLDASALDAALAAFDAGSPAALAAS